MHTPILDQISCFANLTSDQYEAVEIALLPDEPPSDTLSWFPWHLLSLAACSRYVGMHWLEFAQMVMLPNGDGTDLSILDPLIVSRRQLLPGSKPLKPFIF